MWTPRSKPSGLSRDTLALCNYTDQASQRSRLARAATYCAEQGSSHIRMLAEGGQSMKTALWKTQHGFQVTQGLPLQPRVVMFREHNRCWDFLHGPNEMEACVGKQISPAFYTAHFAFHSLLGCVLGLCQTVCLSNAFEGTGNLRDTERSMGHEGASSVNTHHSL